ncbi:Metallo-hydrolase/oxidoreductase [Aspergillus steynii IBT 23096]|uniref:Metallo-hydrolase/oxidoreductase n=1 Tax=Aspergillus steynii IBT 23096 TaxID=1392250 RepID=A0A2I2FWM2_9EURO|nr:Metallo-hydrolase/oxidoreductase [Aspergillus steynii IBT 23096]PLB45015.1 Metallo-hydrolase/oxidoreductase [Aspergillus steynii IBT 23096]
MAHQEHQPSLEDKTDFENASRGFIGSLDPCIIHATNGRVVWNNDEYGFVHNAECPETANPKLWRQAQLVAKQGLFEVTPGIYQVRGFDLANMTIVEGDSGIIIIDPLTSSECSAAALALYQKHRGGCPVTGLIYSHSHIDHFGGAKGVLPESADIPILAPEGFMEEATSENMLVGPAMRRRAMYMYGSRLPKSPEGQLGCGIGMAVSNGTNALVPPNETISRTGQEKSMDGVRIRFQMVPGTEASAEMNFHFPDRRALYIAECATHFLHNIITLRGALVRDAKAWAHYLDESLVLYGDISDVLFAGHNWPTWGQKNLAKMITEQRDLYGYLHDQTVRMMNTGMTGIEIAETLKLPPALQKAWHTQGFYGSVSHNVKGIYQRYVGWFDGNPAHLWEYPPVENARRYVECMGGIEEVVRKAEGYSQAGDLRFAATLLGHAVALDPQHEGSRRLLESVFQRLGYGAENTTWRNFYLSGAQDLHSREKAETAPRSMQGFAPNQSVEQWLSILSVRLDGVKATNKSFTIDITLTDVEQNWRVIISNGILTYRAQSCLSSPGESGLIITLDKSQLKNVLNGGLDKGTIEQEGDRSLLERLLFLTGVTKDAIPS